MKQFLFLLFFITSITTSFAQFGLRATYGLATTPSWEDAIQNQLNDADFRFKNLDVGVDYWFRLKNQRIEFMPTLHYAMASTEVATQADEFNRTFDMNTIGLQVNTHIYFLDFKGDCDCPTWSKNEPWVEKGLFLLVSPAIDYQLLDYTVMSNTEENVTRKHSDLNFNIGVGLGLDIGVSDLITVTPYAGVRFHNRMDWEGLLFDFEGATDIASNMRQIYGGIRLGIRLDE